MDTKTALKLPDNTVMERTYRTPYVTSRLCLILDTRYTHPTPGKVE